MRAEPEPVERQRGEPAVGERVELRPRRVVLAELRVHVREHAAPARDRRVARHVVGHGLLHLREPAPLAPQRDHLQQ